MRVPGELVLGGLFPIHEAGRNATHQCGKIKVDQGVQRMIAMLFAIEMVNKNRAVQTSIGATILDTCSVDSYALEQSLEFIKSVMHTDAPLCSDGTPAQTTREPVVAVIGAAGSQIKKLEWTYVHAIADTGSYGERGMDSFRAYATEKGICIDGDVQKISRRWTEKNFREMLTRMYRTRKARGVVTFVDEDNLKRLLHVLDLLIQEGHTELQGHFWFVASDSWGIKSSVVKGLEHVTFGAITIAPHVRIQEGYMEFIHRLKPYGPFLEEFWNHLNCSGETFGDCFERNGIALKQESYVPFVVDAVNIVAKAIRTYIEDDCGNKEFQMCHLSKTGFNGERLQKYYRNVSLHPGEPPLIDANGDGLGRSENGNQQMTSKCSWMCREFGNHSERLKEKSLCLFVQPIAQEAIIARFKDANFRAYQDQTCCWACIPCDMSTSIHNITHCEECPLGMVPDRTLSYCVNIPPVSMQWNTTWSLIPSVFSLLGLTCTLFVFVVFLKFSSTPVIMASGRELCHCMLAGISMCYLLTFFLVSTPTAATCAAARVVMGLSMSAIYAAIITKTNRLARVFKPDGAQRPKFITPKAQVVICFGIVSIQLVVIMAWLILDKPGTMIIYPSRTEAVLTCKIQITSLCMCISLSGSVALGCFFAPKIYIVLFQPYKNVRTRQSAVGRLVNQQMRFMSQLTYNPESCSGSTYRPFSSNHYKYGSEEVSISQASCLQSGYPPMGIEKLAKGTAIEKKNSLQEKKVSGVVADLRRRRPSSVHVMVGEVYISS
ncbi:hypothetical protein WR25_06767 [Diploscapter pachys]|uniref:G-protein coupled receptors family 3 profile domain-containing protein n=1 Tax=Diploscapter pachys TaxID=2018661 RepID=A0A2A2J454_9BILA|nr:hypothetical protein WR25_06767 [Diploscapter pachys]